MILQLRLKLVERTFCPHKVRSIFCNGNNTDQGNLAPPPPDELEMGAAGTHFAKFASFDGMEKSTINGTPLLPPR